MTKYYSTQRPLTPGTFPKPSGNKVVSVVNYNEKVLCPEIGMEAWGYVEYAAPLSRILADDYELVGGDCYDNQEGKLYHDSYEPRTV